MTAVERADLEARAERAKRRGDMAEALALLQEVSRAHPDDSALAERISMLKETLQPMELSSAKSRFEPPSRGSAPSSPEAEGERLFALGDYAGAAAAYRRALAQKPDSELIRERLVELFRLAQAAPRQSPTDKALPKEQDKLLEALLDRISARRKTQA